MRIQPIQQNFQSKYKIEKWRTFDGYLTHQEKYVLNNGKELHVMTEYVNGQKDTCLQCLFNEAGIWLKSKLRYFKGNKVYKVLKSERGNS